MTVAGPVTVVGPVMCNSLKYQKREYHIVSVLKFSEYVENMFQKYDGMNNNFEQHSYKYYQPLVFHSIFKMVDIIVVYTTVDILAQTVQKVKDIKAVII